MLKIPQNQTTAQGRKVSVGSSWTFSNVQLLPQGEGVGSPLPAS